MTHRLMHHATARRARAAIAALALVTAAATAVSTAPAHAATPTLQVNANQPFRTVTHVATGSLYGLATATVPADNLVEPLHPNTFVQMPAGGHQQGTGDILKVAPEAARAGAKVVDRLSDYYAGWPYQFSWSTWPSAVAEPDPAGQGLRHHEPGRLRAVERAGRHLAVRQRHLRELLDHDLPAGPLAGRRTTPIQGRASRTTSATCRTS